MTATATATWSTHGLSASDAPAASPTGLSDLHVAWALAPSTREDLDVSARYRKVDTLTVGEFHAGRLIGRRPAVPQNEDASVGVLVNLSGRLSCRYLDGREFVAQPGQLILWDSETARDFEIIDPHHELYLLLPRSRVSAGLAEAAARASGAIAAGPGSGLLAIAAQQLGTIYRELDQLSDAALTIACQSLFDVLDCALSTAEQRPTASAALLRGVRQYIEDNLDDINLGPSTIAAAHGISVRTLHQLFSSTGTTVGRWIRDRRLKACYRALSHGGSSETVTDVAFRWGFNDAAHFSRCFKRAFGVTPSSVLINARIGGPPPAVMASGRPEPTLN